VGPHELRHAVDGEIEALAERSEVRRCPQRCGSFDARTSPVRSDDPERDDPLGGHRGLQYPAEVFRLGGAPFPVRGGGLAARLGREPRRPRDDGRVPGEADRLGAMLADPDVEARHHGAEQRIETGHRASAIESRMPLYDQ